MTKNERQFYCINCGEKTNNLFKQYSETVLKLTECAKCQQTADKYIEYDLVIIIVDLILLNTQAYKHIVLNSEFKNFWKLSVILVLLESYTIWSLSNRNQDILCDTTNEMNRTESSLNEFDMNVEDLRFYVICLNVTFGFLCFLISIYVLTKIYQKYIARDEGLETSFILLLKTITLSSTGIFLQLPSIIWDISLYGYHLHFITLYTCLSQLLAYRGICSCPKVWCLVVIFTSYFLKSNISTYLNYLLDNFIFIK